jgi:hypothetical protein
MRPVWLDALFALSLANLNLLPVWRELIFATPPDAYWMPRTMPHDYHGALAVILVLAAVLFALVRLIRRLPGRANDLLFLTLVALALINSLEYARSAFGLTREVLGNRGIALILGTAAVAGAAAVISVVISGRVRRAACRAVYVGALIPAVFALTNVAQILWQTVGAAQAGPTVAANISTPRQTAGRVVWLIFDELDARDLFANRAPGQDYPAFDRFREQSAHFTHARPAGGRTARALPSLWLGRRVIESRRIGDSDLEVQFEGEGEFRQLRDLPHVFAAAKASGAAIALSGWYHPQCRLFANWVDRCEASSFATSRPRETKNFAEAFHRFATTLNPLWRRVLHIELYERTRAFSLAAATDPQLDFVAVHLPVPHGPYIYDRRAGDMTWHGIWLDYADNLALADHYLGELQAAMTAAGLWDDTAVVISADHGRRERGGTERDAVGAVPLLIKLPGARAGETVSTIIDAEIQRDLILALLDGGPWDAQRLAEWLAHQGRAPT